MPLAEIQKLFFRDCPRRLEGDKRLDGLAVNRVGNTDNACLQDVGMHVQNVFNFLGVNVFSAPNDQIFFAVGDVIIAVFVNMSDITRMEPAIMQHGRRLLRLVPVSLHHTGTFDDDLSRLTGRKILIFIVKYFDGIEFLVAFPDGAILGRSPARDIAAVDRCGFAQPIPFPDIIFVFFPPRTGHGGQSVNTTDSAVRITHLPTGLVVTCQDEKSQLKNKVKAMKVLRARLLDAMVQKQNAEQAQTHKSQVGTGDRSERIRTYNFPQGRITDHRINLTRYDLDNFINGNIGAIIDALASHHQAELLNKQGQ